MAPAYARPTGQSHPYLQNSRTSQYLSASQFCSVVHAIIRFIKAIADFYTLTITTSVYVSFSNVTITRKILSLTATGSHLPYRTRHLKSVERTQVDKSLDAETQTGAICGTGVRDAGFSQFCGCRLS
jgi:hypothetical protein